MNTEIVCKIQNNKYQSFITNGSADYSALSFFTPTYNRDALLRRVYECLVKQTNTNFVWIIVNDGSNDNTDIVASELINLEEIPILYIKKKNGGKHSAFKVALENIHTRYCQCMDDDDVYSEDAVDFFLTKWSEIEGKGLDKVGAIRTLTKRKDGSFITNFEVTKDMYGKEFQASTLEMNYIKDAIMENWTCYKTESLKSVDLFPTSYWNSSHHTFFLETIWQGRFARRYDCLYVYKSFRTFTEDASISLTRHSKTQQHYWNSFLNTKFLLDEQYDYLSKNRLKLVRMIIKMQAFRGKLRVPVHDLIFHTKRKTLKFYYCITAPLFLIGKIL